MAEYHDLVTMLTPRKSQAALVVVLFLSKILAQQFEGSQRFINYPGLSPACLDALNTTVSCTPLLGSISLECGYSPFLLERAYADDSAVLQRWTLAR
jgi:hypothetical protein